MNSHRLDDVCTIVMGQAPKGDSYNTLGLGVPLIAGPGDFDGPRLSAKKYTTDPSKLSEVGDIILGIRASIGEKVIADGEYCLGRGVAAIRPSDRVVGRFLWHWLTHNTQLLTLKGRGATFKQVNKRDIGEMLIDLPSVAEQARIAQTLDRVEALLEGRDETISRLEDLQHSIFVDTFITAAGHMDAKLGDHLTFTTSGGRGWAKYYSGSGSRFIRSLDVRMNSISDANPVFVRAPVNAEARRTEVREGDVLLTITGSLIGRVAVVPAQLEGAYVSQHVAILRPNEETLRPNFLSYFLSSESGGQRQISKMQYGQTKPGLNFRQISEFEVPIMSLAAQDVVIKKMQAVRKISEFHHRQLSDLRLLSGALRHRFFSDRPASNSARVS